MVKKSKSTPSPGTKKIHLGLRLQFVIIWFALTILLTNSDLLRNLPVQSNTDIGNLFVAIILLAPIAIVTFPVIYQMGDIYNISEKRNVTPVWIRCVISLVETGILLGILLFLFTVITFALFFRF